MVAYGESWRIIGWGDATSHQVMPKELFYKWLNPPSSS